MRSGDCQDNDEIERPMRPSVETRAEDHIGHLAFCNKIVHLLPIVRIIFEIGVLNHKHISGKPSESGSQRCSFTSIMVMVERSNGDGARRSRILTENKAVLRSNLNG